MPLTTVTIDLEARLAKLESGFGQAAAIAQRNAQRMERAFAGVRGAVSGVTAALAVALPAGFLVTAARNSLNAIDAFNDLKDATGSSIENISALDDVARRTGTTFDTAADVLVKFNKNLKDAKPNDELSRTFQALGLSVAELQRLDPAEALRRTAVALAGFADDGNKARLVQELFGKSVREAAPFLKDLAEAGTLNAKVTTEQAEQVEKLNKEIFRLQANTTDLVRTLVADAVPALNKFFEAARGNAKGGFFESIVNEFRANASADFLQSAVRQLETLQAQLNDNPSDGYLQKKVAALREEIGRLSKEAFAASDKLKGFSDIASPRLPTDNRGLLNAVETEKGSKASAPVIAPIDTKRLAEVEKARRAYQDLVRSVTERVTLAQGELDTGQRLTEQQRFALEVVTKLADTETRYTDAQKQAVTTELERLLALDDANRKQREAVELRAKSLEIEQRGLDNLSREAERRIEANASLAEYVAGLGLSEKQLQALEVVRLREAIATEQQSLAMAKNAEASDDEIAARERNIRLLERQIELRQQGAEKERKLESDPSAGVQRAIDSYIDKTGKLGTETERLFGGALDAVEDRLVNLVSTGNSVVDQLIAEFFRLNVIRPFMTQLLGLFGGGGGFGGALGSIFSFFGGSGGGDITGAFDGFRASGGSVRPGRWSVVGENGPELVAGPGTVFNQAQASAMLGASSSGPGLVQYITINGGVTRNEVISGMTVAKNAALSEWVDGQRRGRWGRA